MDSLMDKDLLDAEQLDLQSDISTAQGRYRRCAPEGTRTPNLLIRSQMLYPLSYGRMFCCRPTYHPTIRGGSGIRTREGA